MTIHTANLEHASDLLEQNYGLTGDLSPLLGENVNYLVETTGNVRYVLKLSGVDCSDDDLSLENAAARHLATRLPWLAVPSLVLTTDGLPFVRDELSDGRVTRVRLLEYISGLPWCDIPSPTRQLREHVGSALAEAHDALLDFAHPAARRTHQWDLAHAGQHRRAVAYIDDPNRRAIAEWMFHFWEACCAPHLKGCPTAYVHGDVNDENLLVDGKRVVGLLDFGDGLVNPLVCDLAITLAYLTLEEDDPLACAAQIVRGYDVVRRLEPVELELLFPLVCARLAVSVTIAAQRRQDSPDHVNWFLTEGPAWRALERFRKIRPAAATATLTAGCRSKAHFDRGRSREDLRQARADHFSPCMSIAYRRPLKMVRGRGQYLHAADGRPYLDLVNNVCHVGHCHPHVVEAGQRQMAELNTNTRYLYDGLTAYARRLRGTLPAPLEICFFVNSGSEANELALRLARRHTERHDLIVLDGAYHGHTSAMIDASPYKFMGAGGAGHPAPWVHVAPLPDGYRGPHRGYGRETGVAYAGGVARVLDTTSAPIAGLMAESMSSCGGQIIYPEGFLQAAFEHVRADGGVCIADEVQVGFGRVGTNFWAFETQGVVPDIVVMGKPIGNGHPLAAVVTTREIAASFDNGMEFFSTFGGNPVSCAIGMAVLDVIEREGLQEHARLLGARLLDGLRALQDRHRLIGDVRGRGLFLGIELVRDRDTLEPAADEVTELVNRLRDRGILSSADGPLHNVIKIKPPMVLTGDDVEMVVRVLDGELTAMG